MYTILQDEMKNYACTMSSNGLVVIKFPYSFFCSTILQNLNKKTIWKIFPDMNIRKYEMKGYSWLPCKNKIHHKFMWSWFFIIFNYQNRIKMCDTKIQNTTFWSCFGNCFLCTEILKNQLLLLNTQRVAKRVTNSTFTNIVPLAILSKLSISCIMRAFGSMSI